MTYEEEQELEEEQAFLAYESNYRRMYEEGEAAGYARGRAEMMLRVYEQEPLVRVDLSKEELAAIKCPF